MSNEAAWNRIASTYHDNLGWPSDDLTWGIRCPPESELRLLGDLRGRRCLVLGCGAGQDCQALLRLGAAEVVGVDQSEEQLKLARQRLGPDTRLLHQSVEDPIEASDMDVVVSIHCLTFVKDIGRALQNAYRILRPGGMLALSVHHPMDASTKDDPPYGFTKPYFQVETHWTWRYETPFVSWYHTVSDWFDLVTKAGFTIERLLEPRPTAPWTGSGWSEGPYAEKLATVPGTLIVVGRKPGLAPTPSTTRSG